MKAKRVKSRNAETKRVQTNLYNDFREKVQTMHDIEDQTAVIREIVPQMETLEALFDSPHKTCVKIINDAAWNDLDIKVYHLPIEEVVDKIAGPIHREFNVDWKMNVTGVDTIVLETRIPATSSWRTIKVNIRCYQGFPACNVVKIEKDPILIDQSVYKVVCS
jgi:hypothetical protein